MLADARQVEHEGLLEFELHFVGHPGQQWISANLLGSAAEVVIPVRAPGHLGVLAGDQRLRTRHRRGVHRRRGQQGLVVVGPRVVVVRHRGQVRVREDVEQPLDPRSRLERQLAALVECPAALPLFLVLVLARISLSGTGFHVVEPGVLHAATVGPGLLAGDAAGVASDAFVEVHHHRELSHDFHRQYSTSCERRLIVVTSSRWLPVGPW